MRKGKIYRTVVRPALLYPWDRYNGEASYAISSGQRGAKNMFEWRKT